MGMECTLQNVLGLQLFTSNWWITNSCMQVASVLMAIVGKSSVLF